MDNKFICDDYQYILQNTEQNDKQIIQNVYVDMTYDVG